MNQAIQDFINLKNIAVVGVSRNDKKFGNLAYKELKERGYQVYAVNPAMKEFQGEPCYPDLSALQGKVDGVLLTVHPDQGKAVLEQASQVGHQERLGAAAGRIPGAAGERAPARPEPGDRQVHPDVCASGALIPQIPPHYQHDFWKIVGVPYNFV